MLSESISLFRFKAKYAEHDSVDITLSGIEYSVSAFAAG